MIGWSVRPSDPSEARSLAQALRVHPFVARVLIARGVTEPDAARAFLAPKLADLTRPEAMADRTVAAERIDRALRSNERIAVFGDYDVDGTTSAALLGSALMAMGGEVVPLVASRFDGGYGLSESAMARVVASGATLLITCDCGTSDHARLAALRARGVESIVVDHHKVPGEPLPAVAFLNPHRPDCGFPFKGLASVGLALSLVAAVRAINGAKLDLREYLDLVAVGTIADVAPLRGDNRILTRAGLDRLADGRGRPGLAALVRESRLKSRVRAHDVGFSIAPMLNAPGRLGSAAPTLALLMARDDAEATRLARDLATTNETRRRISTELTEKAVAQVIAMHGRELPAGIVVADEGWHPGVGGIIAGRLVDRFARPVIVLAMDGAAGVGSARAPKGFTLYAAVARCASDLEQFGGHDAAAGMTVRAERVASLRAGFADACAHVRAASGASHDDGEVADCELGEDDFAGPIARHLDALEPTGQEHPEPVVLARGVRLTDVRPVGTGHLRVRYALGKTALGAFVRDGVARRERGELVFRERASHDVVGRLRPDPYAGPEALQLDLLGSQPAD